MKYTVAIDFATKLGYSIWEDDKLIDVGNFNFQKKDFRKEFKDSGFQQQLFEKTLFEYKEARDFYDSIFSKIPDGEEVKFIFEYSDFSYTYVVEHLSRLLALSFICIDLYSKTHKISVEKVIAVQWRALFKKLQPDWEYSKYEVDGKKSRKIEWKSLSKDFVEKYCKDNNFELSSQELHNNDITDSIVIGYCYTNKKEG